MRECVAHYHVERNHQEKPNVPLFSQVTETRCDSECRGRLGGLLRYFHRESRSLPLHANTGNRSLKLNASLLTCLRQFVILKAIVRDSSTTKIVATLWRIEPRPRSALFVELLSSRLKRATHPTSVECQRPHRCPKIVMKDILKYEYRCYIRLAGRVQAQ